MEDKAIYMVKWRGEDEDGILTHLGAFQSLADAKNAAEKESKDFEHIEHVVVRIILR